VILTLFKKLNSEWKSRISKQESNESKPAGDKNCLQYEISARNLSFKVALNPTHIFLQLWQTLRLIMLIKF